MTYEFVASDAFDSPRSFAVPPDNSFPPPFEGRPLSP